MNDNESAQHITQWHSHMDISQSSLYSTHNVLYNCQDSFYGMKEVIPEAILFSLF